MAVITNGPNVGRSGKIVRSLWFGLRVTLNVPATEEETMQMYGASLGRLYWSEREKVHPRKWITVWFWQVDERGE